MGKIRELFRHETRVTGADRLVDGRKRHVRISVVLVGDVDEVAIPWTTTQASRPRQCALHITKRGVRLVETRAGNARRERRVAGRREARGLAFHASDRAAE